MHQSPSPSVSSAESARQLMPAPFACTLKPDGWGSVWIELAGELDLMTCPLFERVLKEAQEEASIVSVDLQELTFIDCAGLTTVVVAAGRAKVAETRLILVGAVGQVKRLLCLTEMPQLIEMVEFKPTRRAVRNRG
jgi:anti-sigma B factor antagonist